jgi:integrase
MGNPKVEGALRIHFTKDALEAYEPGERPYYVWDTDERGLCLLILPSGVRTYYFRFRGGGPSRRLRLGAFPGLSVAKARRKAVSARGKVADGKDPSEETRERRAEMRLEELLKVYVADHLLLNRKPKAAVSAEQLVRDYLADLVGLKLSDVTRKRVAEWHVRVSQVSKSRANRALEVLSAACSFAIMRELAPARWSGVNPCHGVKANREASRSRFLQPAELGRLLEALKPEPVDLRDFFLALLYTGARRANVQAMKWSDVDIEQGVWRVAAGESKSGDPLAIPLVDEVQTILKRRKGDRDKLIRRAAATLHIDATSMTLREAQHRSVERRKAVHAETFVFPGLGASGHLVEPKTAWARVLKRAEIEDLRLHDVRRTVGSWLAGQGANAFVIGRALGHKSLAATAVYARLDLDPVRVAMQTVATAFAKAGADAQADAAKVVPIKRRRAAK